jgi:hypothetical protein
MKTEKPITIDPTVSVEKLAGKVPGSPANLKAKAKRAKAKKPAKGKAKATAAKPAQRADSKQARFIAAMRSPKGMSIEEAGKAFGWQKHTVRGAIAGAIKKRLGLKVDAEQDEKRGTVYRIKK